MDALLDKAYASQGDALTQATTEVCQYMANGGEGNGGSGELIPAYLNRLWTAQKTTKIVVPGPSPCSTLGSAGSMRDE